jgi:hypothetical protein
MGIDAYLRYRGQPYSEHEQQFTGWKMDQGSVGYLREAYHGGPYATRVLLVEGFEERHTCNEHTNPKDCYEHIDSRYKEPYAIHEDGSPCHCRFVGAAIPATTIAGRLEEAAGTVIERFKTVYDEEIGTDSEYVRAYMDFASLALKWESEGKELLIYVSY